MKTLILESVNEAAKLLNNGEIVAIPTETVYGLAANALNEDAVKKIFIAKGRPADNPLIVHISRFEDIFSLAREIPKEAKILAKRFWPGPLTMILKKTDLVPEIVTAGLDSVAIRLPDFFKTRELIEKLGYPLAAPSANLSGRPSPTSYEHVLNDLEGKISAVLKGENCSVGVESTVVDLTSDPICLLRPGKITAAEISKAVKKDIKIDESVENLVSNIEKIRSPGMKYKHYSPKTKVILVKSSAEKFYNLVNSTQNCVAMAFDEDAQHIESEFVSYGSEFSQSEQLRFLFDSLRKIDKYNADVAYVRIASDENLNLAVFNRLLRASAFNIIDNL